MSNYITTFSKIKFNPINPNKDDLSIDDIAHSLSLLTRANGHFPEFYSVAQHSILCCEESISRGYSPKVSLACLLHDASEAYMSDITRPVKKYLKEYLNIEDKLQGVIYNHFIGENLNKEELKLVMLIDNTLLYNEFLHYMDEEIYDNKLDMITNADFKFIDFKDVENKYKELFFMLQNIL
ncbi:MAG: hypothetical protein ACRC3Y_04235 [Romboutsia sp.]|uniref:hypothetical protein n=1 Tax=Romboutsia sp. TaxID=1965302 RepID=UPI003F335521